MTARLSQKTPREDTKKYDVRESEIPTRKLINPLRPSYDLSQTSHCNIKGLSVREVIRIENMITQVKFY